MKTDVGSRKVFEEYGSVIIKKISDDRGSTIIKKVSDDRGSTISKKVSDDRGSTIIKKVSDDRGSTIIKKVSDDRGSTISKKVSDDHGSIIIKKPPEDHGSTIIKKPSEDYASTIIKKLSEDHASTIIRKVAPSMEVESDMQIRCKFLLMFLCAFFVGMLYFTIWFTTKSAFPFLKDQVKRRQAITYLRTCGSTRRLVTYEDIRAFAVAAPPGGLENCNLYDYYCQNWFRFSSNSQSYQEFLDSHENTDDGDLLTWDPLKIPWPKPNTTTYLTRDAKTTEKSMRNLGNCMAFVCADAGLTCPTVDRNLLSHFYRGACRLGAEFGFTKHALLLQALCVSGCGDRELEGRFHHLCLTFSYFVPMVRSTMGCSSNSFGLKTCARLLADAKTWCNASYKVISREE